MARIKMTDGRWFDLDAAQSWEEGSRWNGNNHISLATGSQWDHQTLYRTAKLRWVLHDSSQWQGSGETYEEVDEATAAQWLVTNGHDTDAGRLFPEQVASLEA
jgi:hypothetical protein